MRAAVVIDEQLVGGRTVGASLAVVIIHSDGAAAAKIVDLELLEAMVMCEVDAAAVSHVYFGNFTVCRDILGSVLHLEVGAFFRKTGITEAEASSGGGSV